VHGDLGEQLLAVAVAALAEHEDLGVGLARELDAEVALQPGALLGRESREGHEELGAALVGA